MGILKRRQSSSGSEAEPSSDRIVAGDEDLSACADALARMGEALLSGQRPGHPRRRLRDRLGRRAAAAGRPHDVAGRGPHAGPGRAPDGSPWFWLAAVADEANARGDARLAARVGFFVHGWREHVAPRMGIADAEDCGGIQLVPSDAYARILAAAAQAVAPLHPDETSVSTSESFVPVSTLRPTLAGALLTLERAGVQVDPRAREEALHVAS